MVTQDSHAQGPQITIDRRHMVRMGLGGVGLGIMPGRLAASGGPDIRSLPALAQTSGGTLTIGSLQEPNNLNPWMTGIVAAWEVHKLMFSSLTKVDPAGQHLPDLAAEVPTLENGGISADLKTYTYTLREDAVWHDGQPVTVDDVLFTWQIVANPATNATNRVGFDSIESAEAPDARTIRFQLKAPNSAFLETWGYHGILPKHLLEGQDINEAEFNRAPVGCGPFKFVEWVTGDRIVVERHDQYHGDGPYLDQIIYRVVPSADTLLTMLETGEVDLRFAVGTEQVEIVRGFDGWTLTETPAHSYFHFTFNLADPILGDVRVRQALTYAVDKATITSTILKGLVSPHWSPVAAPSWAFTDLDNKMETNLDTARQLLDEAGWVTGDGDVRQNNGTKLSIELLNIAGDPERLQVVQLVQAAWKEIGVEVNINSVDVATYSAAGANGEYMLLYGNWTFSTDPSSYEERWLSTSGRNWSRYNNPDVDAALLAARTSADQAERATQYQTFQEIVAEEATNIYMYNRVFFDAVSSRLQGYVPNAGHATNTWNANAWSLAE